MRRIINARDMAGRELRVALRGGQSFVTEKLLDSPQICTFFQHVCTESMSQSVRMNILR